VAVYGITFRARLGSIASVASVAFIIAC
jgi:hypothetical protein